MQAFWVCRVTRLLSQLKRIVVEVAVGKTDAEVVVGKTDTEVAAGADLQLGERDRQVPVRRGNHDLVRNRLNLLHTKQLRHVLDLMSDGNLCNILCLIWVDVAKFCLHIYIGI